MDSSVFGCLSGTRGNRADRAMTNEIQATGKPPAGVPRRTYLLNFYGPLKESLDYA